MIQKTELRIGNVVKVFDFIAEITHLGEGSIGYRNQELKTGGTYELLQPIPLTPEILEKCGFEDEGKDKLNYSIGLPIGNGADLFVEINELLGEINVGIKCFPVNFNYFKDIKYLHQLQNLYFAICQTELPINPLNQ